MNVLSRRTLLQFFGIGATITPVVGGAPVVDAAAKLLAVPSVEPLILPVAEFPNGHDPSDLFRNRVQWNPYEALWLAFWQVENNPSPAVNYGIGVLEHLLGREPSAEDKRVAAAIMQWFGTNCGHVFIEEVLQAGGYQLSWKDNPRLKSMSRLRHGNVWPGAPMGDSVTIQYRGYDIELRPMREFSVTRKGW